MSLSHDILSEEQLLKIKTVILKNINDSESRLSTYTVMSSQDRDGDQIDRANFEYDRNQNITLKNRDIVQIKLLRKAMANLINDTENFGYCTSCGVDISYPRLLICPESIYCLECMRELELKNKINLVETCLG